MGKRLPHTACVLLLKELDTKAARYKRAVITATSTIACWRIKAEAPPLPLSLLPVVLLPSSPLLFEGVKEVSNSSYTKMEHWSTASKGFLILRQGIRSVQKKKKLHVLDVGNNGGTRLKFPLSVLSCQLPTFLFLKWPLGSSVRSF